MLQNRFDVKNIIIKKTHFFFKTRLLNIPQIMNGFIELSVPQYLALIYTLLENLVTMNCNVLEFFFTSLDFDTFKKKHKLWFTAYLYYNRIKKIYK